MRHDPGRASQIALPATMRPAIAAMPLPLPLPAPHRGNTMRP